MNEGWTILENEVWKWGKKGEGKLLLFKKYYQEFPTLWSWREMGGFRKYLERKINVM